MLPQRLSTHKRWFKLGAVVFVTALIAVGAGLYGRYRPASSSTATNAGAREEYAALYQAAWRPDSQQGNVLVTATLMVPHLVQLLGQDSGRSSAEDQLWQATQNLSPQQAGIFMTIDSVGSAIPDATIQSSGALTADKTSFSFVTWHPFIAPSHIVNTDQPTTAQSGLLVFQSGQAIDWSTVRNLKLTIHGIDDRPDRQFIWAEPQLLQP